MSRLLKSFGYAWQGIRSTFMSELNMKIHTAVAASVLVCGLFFRISAMEWIAVMFCIGLVFGAELLNTALESLADKVSPDKNPLTGKAKDAAAGAVLITAIVSVVIGTIIFLPKIMMLF